MNVEQFVEELVRRGRASVDKNETNLRTRQAMHAGFDLVETLKAPGDYLTCLTARHAVETEMYRARVDPDVYWDHRHATAQVEFVWNHLKFALGLPGPHYASVVINSSRILSDHETPGASSNSN